MYFLVQVSRCRKYGATVILHGKDLEEAKQFATEKGKKDDLKYVNG